MKIPEYCVRWVERKKGWTREEKEKVLRLAGKYIMPAGEGKPLSRMDDGFRRTVLDNLERGRATEQTREILLGMLRDAAGEALRRGKIRYNPFLELPPVHRKTKHYPALSEKEVGKLLELDPRIAENACMQVQLLTGMRPAEARGLCWEDVSEEEGKIRICRQLRNGHTEPVQSTKTQRAREIPAPGIAFDILREVRENGDGRETGLVFMDPLGRPMNSQRLGRILKNALGREDVRLHDLRVTHATMLYRATGDLNRVARRLGHSGTDVTQKHYVDARPDLSAARDAQNRYYGEVLRE